ncbi:MAG TPA: hypothetical protein VFQ45_22380 [Longimicrobium sp.]|nr:hypothetical protein [Longimicrobium sp.]
MYAFAIRNDTIATPVVRNIVLTGCQWVHAQELENDTPIRGGGTVGGAVEPAGENAEYEVTMDVHYYIIGHGGQGDVSLRLGIADLEGTASPFAGSTDPDGLTTDAAINDEGGGNASVLFTISEG